MTDIPKDISIVSERFSLIPRNLTEAMEFAKLIASSEVCPKQFQGKPGDVLVAVQYGMELGVPPLQAIQNIAVINGRPCAWGDLLLAVVQKSGFLEEHEEFDANKAYQQKHGWCRVKRKGEPKAHEVRYSLDDAKLAGLTTKPGPWQQYPGRMLQLRARGWALRDKFADVLKGLQPREEIEDYDIVAKTSEGVEIMQPRRKADAQPSAPIVSEPAKPNESQKAESMTPLDRVRVIFGSMDVKSSSPDAKKPWTIYKVTMKREDTGEEIIAGTFDTKLGEFINDIGVKTPALVTLAKTEKGYRIEAVERIEATEAKPEI